MNRAPFREVLELAMGYAGQLVDSTATAALGVLQNFLNARYAEGLYWTAWPELTLEEERSFADEWSATRAWTAGEYCYIAATGKYYLALLAGTGKAPATEALYWVETTPAQSLVATEQWGKSKLGRVFDAWDRENGEERGGIEYRVVPTAAGVVVLKVLAGGQADGSTIGSCWLRYIPQAEVWSTRVYDAAREYVRGDVVLSSLTEATGAMPARGECYRAELDMTGAPCWTLQEFPRVLSGFVAATAGADLLRYYGKPEEAEKLEAAGYQKLIMAARMAGGSAPRIVVRR